MAILLVLLVIVVEVVVAALVVPVAVTIGRLSFVLALTFVSFEMVIIIVSFN